MKIQLILFFILFTSLLHSQEPKVKYDTKNVSAEKIEIQNGKTEILKADTVIVNIYVNNTATLFLTEHIQKKDTSGKYLTYLNFINQKLTTYFNVDIKLRFNKPVEGIRWDYSELAAGKTDYCSNAKECEFTAQLVRSNNGIHATILSKEKVEVTIEGIAGHL